MVTLIAHVLETLVFYPGVLSEFVLSGPDITTLAAWKCNSLKKNNKLACVKAVLIFFKSFFSNFQTEAEVFYLRLNLNLDPGLTSRIEDVECLPNFKTVSTF